MFIELNAILKEIMKNPPVADPVFELHPLQISGYLEAIWEAWRKIDEEVIAAGDRTAFADPGVARDASARAVVPALGTVGWSSSDPDGFELHIGAALEAVLKARDPLLGSGGSRAPLDVHGAVRQLLNRKLTSKTSGGRVHVGVPWSHLMYAYLIENTRIYEIFERVLREALFDENLGALSDVTFRFVRTTEDLFFRPGNSSLIASITSSIRPDARATRRNAYQRMFGIDLNHGGADGGPYDYPRATAANSEFVRMLQELLRELWRASINARNSSGPNTTDPDAIRELVSKLRIMMNERRLSENGRANLAREEFVAVATMGWFHLAVASDNDVVDDLRARSDQREDRLRKIGERVKLPAHGKSRSFFALSDDLPPFLREIEEGLWDGSGANVNLLFDPEAAGSVALRTLRIVNHWSIATGVDLKSVPVTAGAR
jgi:hypothetical protein